MDSFCTTPFDYQFEFVNRNRGFSTQAQIRRYLGTNGNFTLLGRFTIYRHKHECISLAAKAV